MSRAVLIHMFNSLESPGKRKSFLFTFTYNCWGNNLLEGGLSLLGSLSEFGLCNFSLEINISLQGNQRKMKWNKSTQNIYWNSCICFELNWQGSREEEGHKRPAFSTAHPDRQEFGRVASQTCLVFWSCTEPITEEGKWSQTERSQPKPAKVYRQ